MDLGCERCHPETHHLPWWLLLVPDLEHHSLHLCLILLPIPHLQHRILIRVQMQAINSCNKFLLQWPLHSHHLPWIILNLLLHRWVHLCSSTHNNLNFNSNPNSSSSRNNNNNLIHPQCPLEEFPWVLHISPCSSLFDNTMEGFHNPTTWEEEVTLRLHTISPHNNQIMLRSQVDQCHNHLSSSQEHRLTPQTISTLYREPLQLWKIGDCRTILVILLFWPCEQSKEVWLQRATALALQWIPTGNHLFLFYANVFNKFCIWIRQNVPSPYGPPNSANLNGSSSGPEGANSMKSSFLSPTQVQQLRAQIMAYRLLARNQPVPPHVGMAAQGKRTDLPPQPNAGPQGDQQQQQQQMYGPPSQPGQPFQRPPAPAAPPSSMQPSNIRPVGPTYPPQQPGAPPSSGQQPQQQLPSMGPPPSAGAPTPGTTASPVPGTIPTPRPSLPNQVTCLFEFLEMLNL